MFISIKSKVSSTLMNTVTLAILIQVRFDGYLGELEEVVTCTDMLQIGVVGLGELFSIVQRAVRGKLSMTVKNLNPILTMLNS